MSDLGEEATRRVLDRASACDPDAWEFLYRRGRLRLYRYARQRLSDDAWAEDAVVEAVVRSIRAITDLSGPATEFDLWIATVLREHVLPNLRRRRRRGRTEAVASGTYIDLTPTVAGDGSRSENVRQAFNALDHDARDLLDLRVLSRLRIEEVAYVMGSAPDRMRSSEVRALDHMRYMLDEELDDDAILRELAEARTVPVPDLEQARVDALRALALAHRHSADDRVPVQI